MSLHQTNKNNDHNDEFFIYQRLVEGDHHALRFFFDKYYEDLCNYVNLYIRDQSVSEDIVQEIFIYLWEKRGIIKIENSVKSYLLRASRNKFLNHIRSERSHQSVKLEIISKNETYVDTNFNQLDINRIEGFINASIEKLPPRCREIYLLHRQDDLSYKEIASIMDISEKTVENQMTIALKRLKEQLAPFYDQIFVLLLIGVIGK